MRDIAGVIVRDIALNIANVLSLKDFKRMEYRALLNFNQSLQRAALKITQKYIKTQKIERKSNGVKLLIIINLKKTFCNCKK